MKRLVVAFSVWAAALSASTANAADTCSYTVTGASGFLCPVSAGAFLCLSRSPTTGACDTPLTCLIKCGSTFCLAQLRPKSGPEPQCALRTTRLRGLQCFRPFHPAPTPTPIVTTVNVTLQEFMVTPDQSSVAAGHIRFHVSNIGEDMHEFLVIRTDLAPDMLPTNSDGSYMEDGPGTDLLDEIDLVPSGESRDLDIDLAAGNYVLICNMVHMEEGGEVEVHYQLGMRTAFTVH